VTPAARTLKGNLLEVVRTHCRADDRTTAADVSYLQVLAVRA